MTAPARRPGDIPQRLVTEVTLLVIFIDDLRKIMCSPYYLFDSGVKVAGVDLEEYADAGKARLYN